MSIADLTPGEEERRLERRVGEADAVKRSLGLDGHGRWKRRIGWALALLVVGAIATFAIIKMTAAEPPKRWLTAPVQAGELTTTVTATGSLAPLHEVSIAAEISGRITKVAVTENDLVTKDQVLVEIDTERLRSQLAQAEAQADVARAATREARATLTEARADLARLRAVAPSGGASGREVAAAAANAERAAARVASAEAQAKLADAQVASVQTDLGKAVIVSPIDGIVLTRLVEPGTAVAASFQAPVLMTLAQDLSAMELDLAIDEADVGRVKKGQSATFTVDAFSDRSFPATVTAVLFASKTVSNVVTYPARLAVDNREGLLRPGMTTTATITTGVESGVLMVPNAALRFSPPATGPSRTMFSGPPGGGAAPSPEALAKLNAPKVYVLVDGQPSPIAVEVGSSDGQRTAVRGPGIAAGVAVVIGEDKSPERAP
ncbi:MAG: efflux RND transporter periplasmic adaptor subunit [Myxococcota bacterium]